MLSGDGISAMGEHKYPPSKTDDPDNEPMDEDNHDDSNSANQETSNDETNSQTKQEESKASKCEVCDTKDQAGSNNVERDDAKNLNLDPVSAFAFDEQEAFGTYEDRIMAELLLSQDEGSTESSSPDHESHYVKYHDYRLYCLHASEDNSPYIGLGWDYNYDSNNATVHGSSAIGSLDKRDYDISFAGRGAIRKTSNENAYKGKGKAPSKKRTNWREVEYAYGEYNDMRARNSTEETSSEHDGYMACTTDYAAPFTNFNFAGPSNAAPHNQTDLPAAAGASRYGYNASYSNTGAARDRDLGAGPIPGPGYGRGRPSRFAASLGIDADAACYHGHGHGYF